MYTYKLFCTSDINLYYIGIYYDDVFKYRTQLSIHLKGVIEAFKKLKKILHIE